MALNQERLAELAVKIEEASTELGRAAIRAGEAGRLHKLAEQHEKESLDAVEIAERELLAYIHGSPVSAA